MAALMKSRDSGSHRTFSAPQGRNSRALSRQIRHAHQVFVALARGTAALVDVPDDEGLATAHVARGENAGEIGCELPVVGLDVGTGVGLEFELLHDLLLGTHEAHR